MLGSKVKIKIMIYTNTDEFNYSDNLDISDNIVLNRKTKSDIEDPFRCPIILSEDNIKILTVKDLLILQRIYKNIDYI